MVMEEKPRVELNREIIHAMDLLGAAYADDPRCEERLGEAIQELRDKPEAAGIDYILRTYAVHKGRRLVGATPTKLDAGQVSKPEAQRINDFADMHVIALKQLFGLQPPSTPSPTPYQPPTLVR